MSYYFSTTLTASFADAVARTVDALKAEGFGVITDIDVQKTLQEKIGVRFRKLQDPWRLQSAARLRGAAVGG